MTGRYGSDKLNMLIIGVGVVLSVISIFIPGTAEKAILNWVKLGLLALSYGLLFWAIFRCLSHNTYKRYQENHKYLMLLQRLKDREHRYFDCPRCRQQVRVPRGKGKIAISCPKCKEKFIKKT